MNQERLYQIKTYFTNGKILNIHLTGKNVKPIEQIIKLIVHIFYNYLYILKWYDEISLKDSKLVGGKNSSLGVYQK